MELNEMGLNMDVDVQLDDTDLDINMDDVAPIISPDHSHVLVESVHDSTTYYRIIDYCNVVLLGHGKCYDITQDLTIISTMIMTSNDPSQLKAFMAVLLSDDAREDVSDSAAQFPVASTSYECIARPSRNLTKENIPMITFGPNMTAIAEATILKIDWRDFKLAIHTLLNGVFGERFLAIQSLTGRIGPKGALDPRKIEDITSVVSHYCDVPVERVRDVIKRRCQSAHKKRDNRMARGKEAADLHRIRVEMTEILAEIRHESYSQTNSIQMVSFGENNTTIPKLCMSRVIWNKYKLATCGLAYSAFSPETLGTHSLSGKNFWKRQLDKNKVADIIHVVEIMCKATKKEVQDAISDHCNVEYKKYTLPYKRELEALMRIS
ncbi:PREDICTED: uncharacterized protein LOC108560671 [Nicrophorus vespilloides]|uniref:Uncharacterized protein LOC108560671 n=1 Tax=Nicrophorus vespilloides TaxID=110193 RepID=A0ABM1MGV5_NICVS|nr:PREDICTED: uncharacterized protein LOC108560671 [Nicrophorus vespilloides]